MNGLLATPWNLGTYTWIDDHTVKAVWSGFTHILSFNHEYTQYSSVRENDGVSLTGMLISSDKQSKIPSICIDYKNQSTELCYIMKKYNIDKSSQRENPGPDDSHHCHPYSLLYYALFNQKRHESIAFCEIGIAEGRSLLAWEEFFTNAEIYGFEFLPKWLDNWKDHYSYKSRIHVNRMDVRKDKEIFDPFLNTGVQFDCIIDDSSHVFYDMIRIIHQARYFLKPGGMIIIEDIRKAFDELWFYNELKDILDEFQTVFFVDLEHDRRNSGTVNNDKVLILIKKGTPIFNSSLIA